MSEASVDMSHESWFLLGLFMVFLAVMAGGLGSGVFATLALGCGFVTGYNQDPRPEAPDNSPEN